jgi:hypothetical protein
MAALNFPANPTDLQIYPTTAQQGVGQWQWRATTQTWEALPFYMQVRQGDYNSYNWPNTAGGVGNQLTTDGTGGLSWFTAGSTPQFQLLGLLEAFDGTNVAFTLVQLGTSIPFTPVPSTNIAVFLGGVPQVPIAAYSVFANTITFTEAPLPGATFYAISTVTTL